MALNIDLGLAEKWIDPAPGETDLAEAGEICRRLFAEPDAAAVKGWLHCAHAAVQLDEIRLKAEEIRKRADVFVLVGVGGSNQAARAMIEALGADGAPDIVYAGNTLSAHYLRDVLRKLEGRSVYINVIAKNFETLEPGSHYRILRSYMESRYGAGELAARIILTGSRGSLLESIARDKGHLFLEFPVPVGGRYSAFTPVGLLPMAAAGLDIDAFLRGGHDMEGELSRIDADNPAIRYAVLRNQLFKKGFLAEMLAAFEPRLAYFEKWWWQLFGESEGKDGTGIFPAFSLYSEDLHSIGQYMQSGQRILMETFIMVKDSGAKLALKADGRTKDQFDYLEGWDFAGINRAAETATLEAHSSGGVPCMKIIIDRIDEYHFGLLFYFFMLACAVSGSILGVNPFSQDGVECYKKSMFKALGK